MIQRIWRERQSLAVLALKGSEALVGAAMAFVLARLMGPETFGVFAFGLGTVTLLAIPIKNGASTVITKEIAIAQREKGQGRGMPFLKTGIRFSLIYSLFISSLLFITVFRAVDPSPFVRSVAVFSLALPFLCLVGLLEGVLRGSYRPFSAIVIGTVLIPMLVLSAAAVQPEQIISHGWQKAATIYVIVAMFVLLIAVFLSWPNLKSLLSVSKAPGMMLRSWIGVAFPFVIVSGLLILNRQIDLILLGILAGEGEVGIYRVAAQAAVLVTFGVQAIAHLYAPYLAVADSRSDPVQMSEYLRKSVIFSVLFGVTALVFLAIWGGDIIVLLAGPEFLPGYPVMLVLCAANLAVALNGAIPQALYMLDFQTKAAWVFASAALLSIVTNVIMIPLYGMLGAAIATSSAIIFWSFGLRLLACRVWNLSLFTLTPSNNN